MYIFNSCRIFFSLLFIIIILLGKGDNRDAPRDRQSPLSVPLSTALVYVTYISASVAFVIDVMLLIFNLAALRKP